jgi:hypothetical protein
MDKPTKIFIAGAGIAAGLAAFCAITNAWNAQRAEGLTGQVLALIKECEVKEGVIKSLRPRAPIGPFDSYEDASKARPADPGDGSFYFLMGNRGNYKWLWTSAPDMRCASSNLASTKDAAVVAQFDDVQRSLAEKQKEAWAASSEPMELPYFIAFGIFLISALPWSWYFVLRRIRELSGAIRGRSG